MTAQAAAVGGDGDAAVEPIELDARKYPTSLTRMQHHLDIVRDCGAAVMDSEKLVVGCSAVPPMRISEVHGNPQTAHGEAASAT